MSGHCHKVIKFHHNKKPISIQQCAHGLWCSASCNMTIHAQRSLVGLCMQDYKSLCAAVTICSTLFNIQTQTAFWAAYRKTSASCAKNYKMKFHRMSTVTRICKKNLTKQINKLLSVQQIAVNFVQIATEPATWTEVHHRLTLCHVICHLHCTILQQASTIITLSCHVLTVWELNFWVSCKHWSCLHFTLTSLATNGCIKRLRYVMLRVSRA